MRRGSSLVRRRGSLVRRRGAAVRRRGAAVRRRGAAVRSGGATVRRGGAAMLLACVLSADRRVVRLALRLQHILVGGRLWLTERGGRGAGVAPARGARRLPT